MYLKATAATLAAWLVGLLIDVNLGAGDWQLLYLRVLLPRQYMHNKENAVTMRLSAH